MSQTFTDSYVSCVLAITTERKREREEGRGRQEGLREKGADQVQNEVMGGQRRRQRRCMSSNEEEGTGKKRLRC